MNSRNLQLYVTAETPCSYFEDRMSRNLVPDPEIPLNMPIFNSLIQHGFRRSGKYSYRPYCNNCKKCIACRVPVDGFIANRSQKRCLKKNSDVELSVHDATYKEEYFSLYSRYLNSRHADGSMANPAREDFRQFLYCNWSDTRFMEFRLSGKLVAIAVTDFLSDGLSAVYSFFEPELEARSLGTLCILKQIEYALEHSLQHVYLGYWIEDHPKMQYKINFRPLEIYHEEQWHSDLPRSEDLDQS